MNIELVKIEARECDDELNYLWFEATINDKTYGKQMVLCNPASYENIDWQIFLKTVCYDFEMMEKRKNLKLIRHWSICS